MMKYVELACGHCGKPFSAMINSEECLKDYCSDACDEAEMLKAREWLRMYYQAQKNCN